MQTISASFSYSFSGAGSSQITDSKSNSASAIETDTSKGTYDNGVDKGTSKNSGAEQMIYSSNYVYDGSNTTSQGFADTHSSTATANWQLTSFTTTGGFKNSPASGSAGASVSYNETTSIDSQLTNALGVTRTYNGSGPTASASSSGSYFVGAAGATHSNLSLTVDPTGGVDTRSGSYGGASTQSMNSSFTETGNATYVGMLEKHWNYQHTTSSQKNVTDAGSYSTPQGDGIKSSQFSADGLETATYTITVWDDALNGWGPSYRWMDKFPNKVPLTVSVGFDGMSGNPPPDDPAAASSGWTEDDVLDAVQIALDVAGFFPGVGEPFDLASGLISLYRDDYWGFALSLGSAIPFAGWAGGAAKLAKRGAKFVISHVDEAAALGKAVISKTDSFGAALGKIGGRVDDAGSLLNTPLNAVSARLYMPTNLASRSAIRKGIRNAFTEFKEAGGKLVINRKDIGGGGSRGNPIVGRFFFNGTSAHPGRPVIELYLGSSMSTLAHELLHFRQFMNNKALFYSFRYLNKQAQSEREALLEKQVSAMLTIWGFVTR